jgi:hypothetical protein
MAYDQNLADRLRDELDAQRAQYEELNMMGGLCFMIDDKMCVGIVGDQLMARINPDIYQDALTREGASEMNFTGRAMKGFVFVNPEGVDMDNDLAYWVELCLEFNPFAKSSKK